MRRLILVLLFIACKGIAQIDSSFFEYPKWSMLVKAGGAVNFLLENDISNLSDAYPRGGSHTYHEYYVYGTNMNWNQNIVPYLGVGVLSQTSKNHSIYLGIAYTEVFQEFYYRKSLISNSHPIGTGNLPINYDLNEDKGYGKIISHYFRIEFEQRFRLFGNTFIKVSLNPSLILPIIKEENITHNLYNITSNSNVSSGSSWPQDSIVNLLSTSGGSIDKPSISGKFYIPFALGFEQKIVSKQHDIYLGVSSWWCIRGNYYAILVSISYQLRKFGN